MLTIIPEISHKRDSDRFRGGIQTLYLIAVNREEVAYVSKDGGVSKANQGLYAH